jgi:hypothetical protein
MRVRRIGQVITLAGVCVFLAFCSAAQQPTAQLPADLASVPDVIKSGKWKDVDLSALTPLEYCRALLVLNHALDEIGPVAVVRADLLSTYLDQQKLGPDFTNHGPPMPPPKFTLNDCIKIADALLRGPMATSDSATAYANLGANGLEAYRQLDESMCERKWAEVTESTRQIRCMVHFLKDIQRWADFQRWAPEEIQRRQQQYEQMMAQRRAATVASTEQQKQDQEQAQLQQEQQENQKQQAENQQMQQSLAAAQQQMAAPGGQGGTTYVDDDDGWGWNYYGAVDNLRRAAWARDVAYHGAARAATTARITGWHATGGVRR